jgi:hypothetical protein
MPVMLLLAVPTAVSWFTYRMHQLYGSQNDRILSKVQHLVVKWLPCGSAETSLSDCNTSCVCLEYPSMDLQMYSAIIVVLWRMSVSQNWPSWSDIMRSSTILYKSLLLWRLFVLEKRIAKPTMLICWQSRSRQRDNGTYVGTLWFDLWGYFIWKTFLHDNIGWLVDDLTIYLVRSMRILILLILVLQKVLHWVSWQHYVLQRFKLGVREMTIYCIELPHCISSTRGECSNSDVRTSVTSVCISEWK